MKTKTLVFCSILLRDIYGNEGTKAYSTDKFKKKKKNYIYIYIRIHHKFLVLISNLLLLKDKRDKRKGNLYFYLHTQKKSRLGVCPLRPE